MIEVEFFGEPVESHWRVDEDPFVVVIPDLFEWWADAIDRACR